MANTETLAGPDQARHARMRWNTPLSDPHCALLLDRLHVPPGARVLDLGCGWGELLLRAVSAAPDATEPARGVGVDRDAATLERGRRLAAARGLGRRVSFAEGDAAAWQQPAERVICVGASHAFGGTEQALQRLAALVSPGGRLLFGDGCWETPPTEAAATLFGPDVLDFADLVGRAATAGWRVRHLSTADQREWDDFESTWTDGQEEWLAAHPDDPRAEEVREMLDERRTEYLTTYRGVLGFCYLVLARAGSRTTR
ncbi:MAG: methyltransferase domain-containing protein [Marmoricola sp.]